jgi:hypothetical protein
MPTFPLLDVQRLESVGAVTASSHGTLCTAHASANTKATSYTELIASTAFAAQSILITFENASASTIDFLFDIAVGASSSEQIIIANLQVSIPNGVSVAASFWFPIHIASGSRISARCQCTTGAATVRVSALLFGGGFASPERHSIVDTYGAATADSGGTSVDPGGSSNTKGSYSQLTAATTRPHKGLLLAIGNQINGVRTGCAWLLDIAIGASLSEQVIIPNLSLNADTTKDMVFPQAFSFIPITIPAGTRLAARAQCSITDATDRLLDVVAYGVG